MTRAINTLCQIIGLLSLVGLFALGGWEAFVLGTVIIIVISYDAYTSGARDQKAQVAETPDEDPR